MVVQEYEYVRAHFHIYALVEASWRPASARGSRPVLIATG